MADLMPGQFELDGFVFGRPEDPVTVLEGGFVRGAYDVRHQDYDDPVGDSLLFGRDRLTPGEWSWDLAFRDPTSVRSLLARFAAVWRADGVRRTPGAVVDLRYNEDGVTYLVRGRPRRLTWATEDTHDPTWRTAVASFQLAEATVYLDELDAIALGLVSTSTSPGLILPFVLPALLGESSASERRGLVVVGGAVETPLVITITGPSAGQAEDVVISTVDWKIALSAPVAAGDTIVIDTGRGTMTKNGQPYAGISRDSSLMLRIPPGATEMTMTASDSTASLQASVSWRDAYPLI